MTDPAAVHPLFKGVEEEVVNRLLSHAAQRTIATGDLVLAEDDRNVSFFILLRGSVKVFYASPEGVEVVVKLFRAPAAFGEMECLSGLPYLESVRALEKSEVLDIPQPAFVEALESSHRLTFNMLNDLSARLCIAAQNARSLAFNPVETRLAQLLLTYVDMYGLPVEGGTKIRIPLTQEELANSLGVARRSVTRALKRWMEQGILLKAGRHFVVREVKTLASLTQAKTLGIGYRTGSDIGRRLQSKSK